MKFAWIEGGKVRDVAQGDPAALYHPDVAKLYSVVVPDTAASGDAWDGSTLTKPTPPAPPAPVVAPKVVSPLEFKLLFTSTERIAIKDLTATDKAVADWYGIIEDPRLTAVHLGGKSTAMALGYLEALQILTADRKAAILAGEEP